MASSSASSSARKEKNLKPLWQWCSAKVEYLIVGIKEYKTEMNYKNIDFNSDVVALYSCLRECMAIAFDVEDFGPVELPVNEGHYIDEMSKEEKKTFETEVAVENR